MGSRTADKLKEIEELRSSLGRSLEEVEQRIPLSGFGKKIAAAVAGSSVAGSALAFGLRRVRGGRKRKKKAKDQPAAAPAVVTVNVFPKGAAWLAAVGLAGWAGYKIYEAVRKERSGADRFRPTVVTPIPEQGRQAGN